VVHDFIFGILIFLLVRSSCKISESYDNSFWDFNNGGGCKKKKWNHLPKIVAYLKIPDTKCRCLSLTLVLFIKNILNLVLLSIPVSYFMLFNSCFLYRKVAWGNNQILCNLQMDIKVCPSKNTQLLCFVIMAPSLRRGRDQDQFSSSLGRSGGSGNISM
jgi:hypothetical protein